VSDIKIDVKEGAPEPVMLIDTPTGKRVFVYEGDAGYQEKEPIDETRAVQNERQINLVVTTSESFVAACNRYMDRKLGVIHYNDIGRVDALLNERIANEHIELGLQYSTEYKMLGLNDGACTLTQKDFVRLIESVPIVFNDADRLKAQIQRVCIDKAVKIVSDADPDNFVLGYESKTGPQTSELPKHIDVVMPLYEGSGCIHEFRLMVQPCIKEVKAEGSDRVNVSITFELRDPMHAMVRKAALKAEIEAIQSQLNDVLFLHVK
jgi:hypothetical protein